VYLFAAVAACAGGAMMSGLANLPAAVSSAIAQDSGDSTGNSSTDSDAGSKGTKQRSGKSSKGGSSGGTLVQVDKVRSVPMVQTIPVVGRLVAIRAGMVAARIDAPVAEMKVDIGDAVKKGQTLALLADEPLRLDRDQKAAELAAVQAAVNTAKSRLSLAEQELRRYGELQESSAFPKARYEDKQVEVARLRTEITEAKANVQKARASLGMTETLLAYSRILAPYDGTITRRHTEMGAFVKEGEAVYTMVSDRNLEIEVDVPASRIGVLKPGGTCAFEIGNGKTYDAVVRAIVPQEDMRTRTRTVRLTPNFGDRPDTLAANQSVTVRVPIGSGRDTLSVHKDALVATRGQPTVFVVNDGRAQLRTILVGDAVGARVEVLDGLKSGDIVVVRGNERLRDGSRVRFNGMLTQ
jgi:RND family efflux transporter MFP subunit